MTFDYTTSDNEATGANTKLFGDEKSIDKSVKSFIENGAKAE